jgi:hypothetical protein
MKTSRLCLLASLMLLGLSGPAGPRLCAYPPAPHHIVEGVVRDAYGHPLNLPSARILLETVSGKTVTGRVTPEMGRGLNYALTIPMDAGVTAEEYRPTALQPWVPFRLKVQIGNLTYLPIEMTANYATLGLPAQRTRLDLTLGEDSDGDGLPDAWELALAQQLGGRLTLAQVRPEDDLDGDGLTNLQEYLAGTYAYDRAHSILLNLVALQPGRATLEFTVARGRTYTVLAGSDLTEWSPVPFQIAGVSDGPVREYRAQDVRLLRVEVAVPDEEPAASRRFFKLRIQ